MSTATLAPAKATGNSDRAAANGSAAAVSLADGAIGERPRWLVLTLVWLIPGILAAAQSLLSMSLQGEMPRNWPFVVIQIPAWLSWALLTPIVVRVSRRAPIQREHVGRALATHAPWAVALAVLHGAFWLGASVFVQYLREPGSFADERMAASLGVAVLGRLLSGLVTYGAIVGVATALDAQRRLREREVRSVKLEGELSAAQLSALKMQLHPHFLFNTLHAISVLIGEDPVAARRTVMRLGDLLRLTLSRAAANEVALSDELELVRLYLEIERTRFQDRLTVDFEVPHELLDARVPDLILQPLVENALKHGVAPRAGAARIVVRAARDDGSLVLEVSDNGGGPPPERARRDGVGLRTTRRRLAQRYGDAQRFELVSAPVGGCLARITIPFEEGAPA
jgi:two-component system LytT family sensor kinase